MSTSVYLLAAGIGSRLRPITSVIPKCLAPIGATPLLGIWMNKLSRDFNIYANVHHKCDLIENYLANSNVNLIREPRLLGTGCSIAKFLKKEKVNNELIIIHADNYSSVNIMDMYKAFDNDRMDMLIGTFVTDNPKSCGIIKIDQEGRVISFAEKPKKPESNLANAAIYIFGKKVLEDLRSGEYPDLSVDFIAKKICSYKAFTYPIEGEHRDIGTIESLKKVKKISLDDLRLYADAISLTDVEFDILAECLIN